MTPSTPCECSIMCQDLGEEGGCRYKQPARETLRRLVDITYQHATEDEQVPATHTADLLIDRAFGVGSIPPSTPAPTGAGALATAVYAIERWQANRMTTFTASNILNDFGDVIVAALRKSAPQETRGDEPDSADDVVTRLYRRFKDWSKRGFGPDDVTWCEVKADINEMIALAASQQSPRLEREGIIQQCADVVGIMRQSEAGLFDAKHSGQRGCDRADALYDAYVAIRALLSPPGPMVPWELDCQRKICAAPECECPAVSSTSQCEDSDV